MPGEVLEEHVDHLLGLELSVSFNKLAFSESLDLEMVAWGFLAIL